ncbi:helix-turn-helix domain-containing protein [Chitinophaga sp. RCC_12]|uniref:helix-turn-helix domain-containing protein n=1 Tax=Chitinophaga sp. RCC_12 TaxID=3239226 RepID=UPI00352396D6
MEKIPVRHITTTQQGTDAAEGFGIRDLQTLLDGEDMVQEYHRHDFFYMLVLEKGSGSHDIDFTRYVIGDYAVFFLRPGQVHRLVLKAGSTGYMMHFNDGFCFSHHKVSSQLLRRAGNINHYQLNPAAFQKLQAILTDIFREYTGKQENYRHVIKAHLDVLFIELIRQYSDHSHNNVNLYRQEQLDAFLGLLETHVLNCKQVSQYAAMLNLSSYQLNAITRATVGKTCSALINEYIILEAKRQLLATSGQVNQIADHLGYEDVSYFIRFFKKHTGYSPETFRRDYK